MAKKNKVFDLDSKQLPDNANKNTQETTVRDQRSAERELAAIRASNDANMGSIVKLSSSLRKTLDTAKVALPDIGANGKNNAEVSNGNILNILGKIKSKEEAEAIITTKIEQATSQVSLYNHTGVYAKMLEARRNNFIEENLPVTRTSLELYVDDVNNGAFRGTEYGNHNKFRFYRNGSLITDVNQIDKMTEYLNPTDYTKLSDDIKSFDEVDSTGDFMAIKYGNSDTRIISHKNVCKDMYIKYVLKEAKRKTVGPDFVKERAVVAANESALESINDFIVGVHNLDPVCINDNLKDKLGENILEQIPSDLYEVTDRYIGNIGNESVEMDMFTYNEFNRNETFLEFAERYLTGGATKVYNVNPKQDRDTNIAGYCFTYECGGVSQEVATGILQELSSEMMSYRGHISNESISLGIESFIETDKPLVTNLLTTVGFDQIYGTSYERIASYNKMNDIHGRSKLAFESYTGIKDNAFLRANGANTVDKLYIRCFNALNRGVEVSMEDGGIADNTLNPSYGMLELGGYELDTKNKEQKDSTTKSAVEKVKEKRINYNRLEKMFANIKGCTIEYLDNTRKIDLIAGNKKIGCYYIEYTHQDIQHFIGLRTIMGNPITYTQNIDMLNIRTDEQEETLGRLIFSDTIKPLIEQNMDTKFIRNNSDIMYCLQKLMEENELSQSMSYNDLTRYSMYNLSRIIYIPANQLIFKRNGIGPLGESRFTQAVVPATAHILAKEAYLSWILCDGKGISFLTIPKGMSELGGEYGQDHLKDRIEDLNMSRAKLRDMAFNNTPLTHRLVLLEKNEEAEQDIDIKTIEYPDFQIDADQMNQWEREYTSIIGVCSDLFSVNERVEFAKQIIEQDDMQLMRVLKSRAEKKIPSSQLATRMLQERGGQEFSDVTVEWMEPSVNVNNYQKRSDIVDSLNTTIEAYMKSYDAMWEEDEEYKAARGYVVRELFERLMDTDTLLTAHADIVKDAVQKFKVALTEEVEEKNADKENEKEEGEGADTDNAFNPDTAEQNAEDGGEGNPFGEEPEEGAEEEGGNPFA